MRNKFNSGILTIELLIAFAILLISVTGIVLLTNGEQATAVDSETATKALTLAQINIEKAKAEAKDNFDSFEDNFTIDISAADDVLFDVAAPIMEDISECVRKITVGVTWKSWGRDRELNLDTRITDLSQLDLFGGECDLGTNDDWDNPGGLTDILIGGVSGSTSIEAFNDYVYLTLSPDSAGKPDFYIYKFVFDPQDPEGGSELVFQSSMTLSENLNQGNQPLGLNDVDVARIGNDYYAFLTNTNRVNLAADPVNDVPIYNQVIIVNVTNPQNPMEVTRYTLPGVGNSYPEGRVIYYYDGNVYVGTGETAGPEFHIVDVANPSTPQLSDSREINHNVQDIFVRDDYAYLALTASTTSNELLVLDVSNSNDIQPQFDGPGTLEPGFNAPGHHDATRVFVLGDKVYLGRLQEGPQSSDDFFVLNKSEILDEVNVFDGIGDSIDLGIQNTGMVIGLAVSGHLAFIGLDDSNYGLIVLDLLTMQPNSNCAEYNYSENSTNMDMEGDFIFLSNNSNSDIHVIYDKPLVCPTN